jgi:hypothetical protein
MYRQDRFYGVSTVDLKLEGLHAFLEVVSGSFGGYAFAVDRNGKFLSLPDESRTKIYGTDDQGGGTEEFIGIAELAAKQPDFEPLAAVVQNSIGEVVTSATQAGIYRDDLADSLAKDSYQIEPHSIDEKMNALKRLGIRMAIDDFGTGHSSLAYLKQLPLDQLKINDKPVRDIETDPSDAVSVATIISMARHLGLSVVAEGVETVNQFAFLENKECHLFQGFYFSGSLTRKEFRKL